MKKRFNLNYITLLVVIFMFLAVVLLFAGESATIKLMMGDIKIYRSGSLVQLKPGDVILNGDNFKLINGSFVALNVSKERSITIKGPTLFRYDDSKFEKSLEKWGLLFNLYKRLSKSSKPYYPVTVITGVRGEKEADASKRNKMYKEKINRALDLFKNNKLDESYAFLIEIEQGTGLKKHFRTIIKFYKAQILFEQMKYKEALVLYKETYKPRFSRFKYKEEALLKAILCCEQIEDLKTRKDLIGRYKNEYGEDGKYYSFIAKIQ